MSEGRIERYKSDELVSQIASSGSLICNIQESETNEGSAFNFAPYVANQCRQHYTDGNFGFPVKTFFDGLQHA